MFLVSASRNQLNVRYLVLVIDLKIFYEHDVHDVLTVESEYYRAEEAEMRLMFVNLFGSGRRKFFMNREIHDVSKVESSVIGKRRPT